MRETIAKYNLFIVIAFLCFIIALLGALGVFQGVVQDEWVDGGLASLALGLLL